MDKHFTRKATAMVANPWGSTAEEIRHQLREAFGYRELGMFEEAELAFRLALETHHDPAVRNYAQGSLIRLNLATQRFEEASELGGDLVDRGIFLFAALKDTVLALTYLGRIREARETLLLITQCGHELVEGAYQMACFASRLGEFDRALIWLAIELQRSEEHHARAFQNSDFLPFWAWLDWHTPTLQEAHLILATPFVEVRAAGTDPGAARPLSPDDLAALAPRPRRLFKYDRKADGFIFDPVAVATDPQGAADFKKCRAKAFEMIASIIKAAYGRALGVVLNAQAGYAAAQLAWGNRLGARQHILWAVSLNPSLLDGFMQDPDLKPLLPLLEALTTANAADPGFCRRMGEILDYQSVHLEHAWNLLHQTPEALRANPVFRLRLGNLYEAGRDYQRASLIWEGLRKDWPSDVVGFGNGIKCLLKLGRNHEAKAVMAQAPACYRKFHLYWSQRAHLEGRTPPPRVYTSPFMGQPDLGNILLTAEECDQLEARWARSKHGDIL